VLITAHGVQASAKGMAVTKQTALSRAAAANVEIAANHYVKMVAWSAHTYNDGVLVLDWANTHLLNAPVAAGDDL